MYTLLSGLWRYVFQKDEYFVLILGLDNAGKTVSVANFFFFAVLRRTTFLVFIASTFHFFVRSCIFSYGHELGRTITATTFVCNSLTKDVRKVCVFCRQISAPVSHCQVCSSRWMVWPQLGHSVLRC